MTISDNYDIDYTDILGKGAKSTVYSGICKKTGRKVAIKITDCPSMDWILANEILILEKIKTLNSSYFVKLLEVEKTANKTIIVMEKVVGNELFEYCIKYKGGMPEKKIKPFFRNICNAVLYLHSNNIAHLDLKLENIMYNEITGNITLIDFGFAQITSEIDPDSNETIQKNLTIFSGSLHYCSPELVLKQPYDGKKSDIWSLGVLLYSCLFGYFPFDDRENYRLFWKIEKVRYNIPPDCISDDATELIIMMLEKDPYIRLSIDEVLDHPWLN